MDDFGSSGAGIVGRSGFAAAGTAVCVLSCGCSGLTLKKEKLPVEPASPLALSAGATSPPPASSPLLNAFSRLPIHSTGRHA